MVETIIEQSLDPLQYQGDREKIDDINQKIRLFLYIRERVGSDLSALELLKLSLAEDKK